MQKWRCIACGEALSAVARCLRLALEMLTGRGYVVWVITDAYNGAPILIATGNGFVKFGGINTWPDEVVTD